jgi:hypothetical protein
MTYVKDLTTLYVSSSFQRLLQISGSNHVVLDGTGSVVSVTFNSSTGSFSGSFTGDGSGLTGVISASYAESASYEIVKEVSSSYADTASFAQGGSGSFIGDFTGSISGSTGEFDYVKLNSTKYDPTGPIHEEGLIFYDPIHKSMAYYNEQNDVTVNVGLETLIRVKNATNDDIPNGTPVYSNGSQEHTPTVNLAYNAGTPYAEVIGLTTHIIPAKQLGYVTVRGGVHNVDTSMYEDGDFIYLSSSAGELTNITPAAPEYPIRVGQVLNAHREEGIILVNVGPSDVTNHMVINNAVFNSGASGSFSGSFEGSFSGKFEVSGSLDYNVTAVNTSYSLQPTDYYVDIDTSINSCSIYLFDASLVKNG